MLPNAIARAALVGNRPRSLTASQLCNANLEDLLLLLGQLVTASSASKKPRSAARQIPPPPPPPPPSATPCFTPCAVERTALIIAACRAAALLPYQTPETLHLELALVARRGLAGAGASSIVTKSRLARRASQMRNS